MAVYCSVADLVHHAVIHVLETGRHPADIELALLACAADWHISWRIQKNYNADNQFVREPNVQDTFEFWLFSHCYSTLKVASFTW